MVNFSLIWQFPLYWKSLNLSFTSYFKNTVFHWGLVSGEVQFPPVEGFQNTSGGEEGEDGIETFLAAVGFCGYELAIVVKFTQQGESFGSFP